MAMKLIAQGAESKLYRDNNHLIKKRVKKSYRLKELDEKIRKHRNKREAKALRLASKLINVPKVIKVNPYEIVMEYLNGPVIRDKISSLKNFNNIMKQVGTSIAKLHKKDIIHGDLTTSNMIIKDEKVFFIDFGLSESSNKVEAKAVDLHVLKQALESKHYQEYSKAWRLIKDSYLKKYSKGKDVLKRLGIVESRGRYKNKLCI